jgi:histidinol-phosphatase
LQALLEEAVDLARRAGEITLRWFQRADLEIDSKSDGTPVTAADRAAERFLRDEIAARYPNDAILGEEEGTSTGTSGRRWIVDPIDGTQAFTCGVPLYTNLLAVEDTDGPAIGVVNVPALGETVFAGRGLGCFWNNSPARVSSRSSLAGAYLTTSGFDAWDEDMLLGALRSGAKLRTWGDGYGYVLVATGRAEVMVDPVAAEWDLAAMPIIMAEAGGRFTDLTGANRTDGGSGVATNGLLHDAVLGALVGR